MATAREVALRLLETNPKWKLVKPDGQITTIGGGRPVDEARGVSRTAVTTWVQPRVTADRPAPTSR
jgi:hypothetical protein